MGLLRTREEFSGPAQNQRRAQWVCSERENCIVAIVKHLGFITRWGTQQVCQRRVIVKKGAELGSCTFVCRSASCSPSTVMFLVWTGSSTNCRCQVQRLDSHQVTGAWFGREQPVVGGVPRGWQSKQRSAAARGAWVGLQTCFRDSRLCRWHGTQAGYAWPGSLRLSVCLFPLAFRICLCLCLSLAACLGLLSCGCVHSCLKTWLIAQTPSRPCFIRDCLEAVTSKTFRISLKKFVSDVCVWMFLCSWSDWFCRLTWQKVDIYVRRV